MFDVQYVWSHAYNSRCSFDSQVCHQRLHVVCVCVCVCEHMPLCICTFTLCVRKKGPLKNGNLFLFTCPLTSLHLNHITVSQMKSTIGVYVQTVGSNLICRRVPLTLPSTSSPVTMTTARSSAAVCGSAEIKTIPKFHDLMELRLCVSLVLYKMCLLSFIWACVFVSGHSTTLIG